MTTSVLLKTFRNIRDVVADIQQTAAAVDEHVGRFQIFGTSADLAQAISAAENLGERLEELRSQLRRCNHNAAGGTLERGSIQSPSELTQAGVP
jgi:predicted metal-dependent hydrolase